MILALIFLGILVIMGPAALVAYILSAPGNITWKDEGFQKWAFGHLLEEDTPLSEIPNLWNKRNPEHKITSGMTVKESISMMLELYIKEKHSNE